MKDISYYLKLNYPVVINILPDQQFCAEIKLIPGLCAYGATRSAALEELEGVKMAAFALMLKQGKTIPLPTVHLEIPIDAFEHLPQREQIEQFVVIS
jgi:predicted RNase H-like HicB family nuclease